MCVATLKKTYIPREVFGGHISLQGYMSALYPSSVFSSEEDDDGAICGPMLQAGISSDGVRERSVIEMRSVSYE